MKKITVKVLIQELLELTKKYPECQDYEIIYSHDDEGNEYQKVINLPSIAQVHDLKNGYRNLEIVGFLDENATTQFTDKKDCNAVIIN